MKSVEAADTCSDMVRASSMAAAMSVMFQGFTRIAPAPKLWAAPANSDSTSTPARPHHCVASTQRQDLTWALEDEVLPGQLFSPCCSPTGVIDCDDVGRRSIAHEEECKVKLHHTCLNAVEWKTHARGSSMLSYAAYGGAMAG